MSKQAFENESVWYYDATKTDPADRWAEAGTTRESRAR